MIFLPIAVLILVSVHHVQYCSSAIVSILPRVNCFCTSTHFPDASFSVSCERNISNAVPQNNDPNIFTEESKVTCTRGRAPGPRDDYERGPGFVFFKFHPRLTPWEEALRTCAREGATLAIVNNDEEAKFMAGLFKKYNGLHKDAWINNQAWVGANDLEKEGTFITINGLTMEEAGYNVWSQGQPNNGDNIQHCLVFDRDALLNDEACELELPFFCKRKGF